MHKVEVKAEARIDIFKAFLYYEEASEGLGVRFSVAVKETLSQISRRPLHYQITYKDFRQAGVKKFPFVIIYEFDGSSIIVFSVFNTHRNPLKKPKL